MTSSYIALTPTPGVTKSTPQRKKKPDVVGLPQTILDDAESIYKGEAENKGKKGTHLSEVTGTAHRNSKGELVHSNSALDGLGWLNLRQNRISELVSDDVSRETFLDGTNNSGRYSGLSWWDRHIHKISDEDITKGLHRQSIRDLRNNSDYKDALGDLTPEQRSNVTSLTNVQDTLKLAENNRELEALETEIRSMDLGSGALDTLVERNNGKRLDKEGLETLLTDLKPLQAPAIAKARSQDANVRNVDSQIESRAASDAINVRTADLAELTARNDMKIAEADIKFKNDTNRYNWDTANRDRDYNWRTAEADREMKKDLALLGFKDKDADRRYDREESREERRQLMLLQMLKGLQNLGGSMAI